MPDLMDWLHEAGSVLHAVIRVMVGEITSRGGLSRKVWRIMDNCVLVPRSLPADELLLDGVS